MRENPYESPQVVEPSVSPPRPRTLPCAHCGADRPESDGPVIEDSFGFREFECPKCRNIPTLALRPSYRIIYWILLVGRLGVPAFGMISPPLVGPVVCAIVPGYALYRDRKIRQINDQISQRR